MSISRFALILPVLALAACDEAAMTPNAAPTETPIVVANKDNPKPTPTIDGNRVVVNDASQAAKPGRLGTTVASLGDASQPGLWLRTPLVTAPGKGRVVNQATGKSVNVQLLPLGGAATAGSLMSMSAMQALGVGLTDLPNVEVFRS